MQISYAAPSPQEYIDLRIKTGMGPKDPARSEIGLANSLFIVSLWEDGQLIGFGRIIGDGALAYVVSDIMVEPRFQRRGLGKIIMREIDAYLEQNTDEYAFVILLANKPADKLYAQFGFADVEPNMCGMKRKQH